MKINTHTVLIQEIAMLDSMIAEVSNQADQAQSNLDRLKVVRDALHKTAELEGAYDQLELKLDD